jgi:signal transduction histidine kinase
VDSVNKRNPGKKKLEIYGCIHGEYGILDILDNGSGIPPEDIPHLFDPHFSGKKSSGLGLYLVKMLVQKNKGNIEYIPGYSLEEYPFHNPGDKGEKHVYKDITDPGERDTDTGKELHPGACFRLIFPLSTN